MNTGFLGPAVATVLTVYGIETSNKPCLPPYVVLPLQQYLPFTVLKLRLNASLSTDLTRVATVLTVYGIETNTIINEVSMAEYLKLQQYLPFTVLKPDDPRELYLFSDVLQQYLPFTVLKRISSHIHTSPSITLQQYLPFTVLKL